MQNAFAKQVLAIVSSLTVSALALVWGYSAIENRLPFSALERMIPLLVASMFAFALVMTAVRFAQSRDDLTE